MPVSRRIDACAIVPLSAFARFVTGRADRLGRQTREDGGSRFGSDLVELANRDPLASTLPDPIAIHALQSDALSLAPKRHGDARRRAGKPNPCTPNRASIGLGRTSRPSAVKPPRNAARKRCLSRVSLIPGHGLGAQGHYSGTTTIGVAKLDGKEGRDLLVGRPVNKR